MAGRARVLGIIPARGGSRGIPRKNLMLLGDAPLVVHSVRAARASRSLTALVVSTDDAEIAAACEAAGAPVPWLRPAELAGDDARVQAAVIDALGRTGGADAWDYVMLLQPTAPLRTPEDIDACIGLALEHDATSVVSFTLEESHHPWYMYRYVGPADGGRARVEPFHDVEPGLPRQAFPPCAYRNGAIYLVRTPYLQATGRFVSPDVIPYLMPAERSVNIDTPEDLALARLRLAGR